MFESEAQIRQTLNDDHASFLDSTERTEKNALTILKRKVRKQAEQQTSVTNSAAAVSLIQADTMTAADRFFNNNRSMSNKVAITQAESVVTVIKCSDLYLPEHFDNWLCPEYLLKQFDRLNIGRFILKRPICVTKCAYDMYSGIYVQLMFNLFELLHQEQLTGLQHIILEKS